MEAHFDANAYLQKVADNYFNYMEDKLELKIYSYQHLNILNECNGLRIIYTVFSKVKNIFLLVYENHQIEIGRGKVNKVNLFGGHVIDVLSNINSLINDIGENNVEWILDEIVDFELNELLINEKGE